MRKLLSLFLALTACLPGIAGENGAGLDYRADLTVNTSTGRLAPYMIGSWNNGRITGASGIWHDGYVGRELDMSKRFSWSAGVEYIVGYGSRAEYERFDAADGKWGQQSNRQSAARLLQLWGQLKYRGVFLTAGMRNSHSGIVDDALSSGDLVRSNNARAIPGVSAGFIDFQNIPFTNGWVQIDGELMYGRMFDSGMRRQTFNYYRGVLAENLCYTYKRCYFRTKPSQPLSITVGMQTAGLFAGRAKTYQKGRVMSERNPGFHLRDLWDMFFPHEGGEDYYKGSSLGSWDFKARYLFRNGSQLSAYFEWPWEDGSGIGRRNGWDGVWGLQYNFSRPGWVSKIVAEYVDFTNQSGPLHYSHTDEVGSTITSTANGGDAYYNNDYYGAYAYYGMSIGSPFTVAPIYNADGNPGFSHSRCRGFHVAAEGNPTEAVAYKVMVSYQQGGGNGRVPARKILHSTSAMVGGSWQAGGSLTGLRLAAEVAIDAGKLRGNNFGVMLTVGYHGSISFSKKK